MRILAKTAVVAIAAVMGVADVQFAPDADLPTVGLAGPAEARVGHPLTPMSYAGVARRTTRRVVRRTSYRVNTLPPGCRYGPYYGGNYWNCGGTYFEQSGNVYIQVVFD